MKTAGDNSELRTRSFGPRVFDWPLASEAEGLIERALSSLLARNRFARRLEERMRAEAGIRLLDLADHLLLPASEGARLERAGYRAVREREIPPATRVLRHPAALLPAVLLQGCRAGTAAALRVESVADFLAANGLSVPIEGPPLGLYRQALVAEERGARLLAVERRGTLGFRVPPKTPGAAGRLLRAAEAWRTRPRIFKDPGAGFRAAHRVLDRILPLVGRDLACHTLFSEERRYWERRNRAARVQRERQDGIGLGWANHDHHTFRCSRRHFRGLVRFLLRLGFTKRERFYAGAEAGWGAQVLEHPVEPIVVFADLDLLPGEVDLDFSERPLPEASRLGTVGLWVALHGESFLEAGMHHLEGRFDFALVREQLAGRGVRGMAPFSDFSFLKQAFTQGERWPVRPERALRLRRSGNITAEQARRFIAEGAIGSHLETLERRGGFKGFNQKAVSAIIRETDPRRAGAAQA